MSVVHIDCFEAAGHVTGKRRCYESVREAVIKAGRFSCFEATASMTNAVWFTRLCRDPEIETFDLGYPWTGVRLRGYVENHDPGDEGYPR